MRRARHEQEEGQIDDDGMFAAIAQRSRKTRVCASSAASATMAPAPSRPSISENDRPFRHSRRKPAGRSALPRAAARRARMTGLSCAARGKCEDMRGQPIAGVEIDKAAGEFVDHGPAGFDRCRSPGAAAASQMTSGGTRAHEFGDDEEDRKQINEPQRAERLDEGQRVELQRCGRAMLGDKAGRLKARTGWSSTADRNRQNARPCGRDRSSSRGR